MFDWWLDQPTWLKLLAALVIMAIGAYITWFVTARYGVFVLAFGFALLFFCGKSDVEKKGYRF